MSKVKTPPHIVTLSMAAAVNPLAMNVYLPSLSSITEHFNTDAFTVQLSVSLFLGATGIFQILIGPLSDKFGRRPVLLTLFTVALFATIACIFAPNIETFLAARIIQASAAVGIVLSRAIVRDIYGSAQAASVIGYVTMGMTVAPMFGPAIGGYLSEEFGWQASFWLIFAFTTLVMVVSWFDLGETNTNIGASMADTFRAWPDIITSHRFWGYALCCAFSSAAFFAFLGGGPLIAIEYYGLSPSRVGLYFFFVAVGYMFGNFLTGRYSERIGLNQMMFFGNIVVSIGLAVGMVLTTLFPLAPLAFFSSLFLLGLGNGITLPNANAGIVNVRPKNAGAASGLGGGLQIGGGALFAGLVGYFLRPEDGPYLLIWVMAFAIVMAIIAAMYVFYIDRKRVLEAQQH